MNETVRANGRVQLAAPNPTRFCIAEMQQKVSHSGHLATQGVVVVARESRGVRSLTEVLPDAVVEFHFNCYY